MNLRSLLTSCLLISSFSVLPILNSPAQAEDIQALGSDVGRPPDVFSTAEQASNSANANNCHCSCACTHPNCDGMPWDHWDSDSNVTPGQCHNNCVSEANNYCENSYGHANSISANTDE